MSKRVFIIAVIPAHLIVEHSNHSALVVVPYMLCGIVIGSEDEVIPKMNAHMELQGLNPKEHLVVHSMVSQEIIDKIKEGDVTDGLELWRE